jgi:hypothetical protein
VRLAEANSRANEAEKALIGERQRADQAEIVVDRLETELEVAKLAQAEAEADAAELQERQARGLAVAEHDARVAQQAAAELRQARRSGGEGRDAGRVSGQRGGGSELPGRPHPLEFLAARGNVRERYVTECLLQGVLPYIKFEWREAGGVTSRTPPDHGALPLGSGAAWRGSAMSKSSATGGRVPSARELRAVVIPLVEDFGFDDDIYRRLAGDHSIEAVRSKVVNTQVDNALLVRRLEWILRTCREWNLAYGQKETLMTLAKESFLGVKVELHSGRTTKTRRTF